jgi:drug/metabolite transporter (DMT)-like permease
MILIVFLYALCASTFTICKALLDYVKPIFFIGIRMLVAGAILLAYSYWKNKAVFTIHKKDRWLFTQIVLFHVYFAYILDLWSLQYITSSKSSFLYNLSPFLAALFSYFYFSEKMTAKKWLGLLIGFSGFLPEMLLKGSSGSIMGGSLLSLPEIVLLVAVTSGVYGWITLRKLVKDGDYSPIMVNGIGMVGGGILALITSFWVEGWAVSPIFDFWPFAKLTALIIVVGNILFYNFYGFLLTRYTATFLSFAGFTTPIFAALFGWLFLGEVVSWTFFISIFVVFIGLYIFYQEELKQGYSV